MSPKALDSEVPPLNSNLGWLSGSRLKSVSRTRHTQKSFSM